MLSLWGRVTRTSHLLRSTAAGTKRAFHELGYFQPRYAKYGDDDFAEEDMFKSIGSFQRDRGLEEDEEMREDGPTQHHVNAELVKKRRRELDPHGRWGLRDSPGLGLQSPVGRGAENKPEDVRKTKKALAALKMYPHNTNRVNDGKADDDMQFALNVMQRKHAIGVQKGRIDNKAAADKLHELANGNNIRYLAAELQKLIGGKKRTPNAASGDLEPVKEGDGDSGKKATGTKHVFMPRQGKNRSVLGEIIELLHGKTVIMDGDVNNDGEARTGKSSGGWHENKAEQQKELQETISRLSDLIVSSKNGKSAKDVEELDKEMAERGGEFLAELLNLPSKNYVPEKVRGRDIKGNKRTDTDEPPLEYAAGQSVDGDDGKGSKGLNLLRRALAAVSPTAHAADPHPEPETQEEEMQTEKTTTEETDDETQAEVQRKQEVSDEPESKENELGYTNTMHAKSGDPKKKQFDYRNMSNDYLRDKHPEFKISGGINVDESFIFDRESGPDKIGIAQHGYVPGVKKTGEGKPVGSSGVTIGFGVDLGQMNEYDLKRYVKEGTPMYEKLKPYLGKKRDKAVQYLKDNPLELSEGEALALTRSVHSYFNNRIKERYDGEKGKGAYDKLDPAYRTAMLSYHLQMGQNKKDDVWNAALTGNADVFAAALKKLSVKDTDRRALEADYVKNNHNKQRR